MIVIGEANITFVKSKYEVVQSIEKEDFHVFSILKTNLESAFPTVQFLIEKFKSPFILDRNLNDGMLLLYTVDYHFSKHSF